MEKCKNCGSENLETENFSMEKYPSVIIKCLDCNYMEDEFGVVSHEN